VRWRLGVPLLTVFVLVALLVPHHPLAFEERWLDWMQVIRTPALDDVALALNYLGRGLGRALVLVAVGLPLLLDRRFFGLAAFAVVEGITPAANSIVKALVDRPRPPDSIVQAGASSFPSGHTSFAAATLVAAVLLLSAPGRRRRLWWGLAALGVAAMALSRTYLQAHWLLDVVGGALLGAGVALVVLGAARRVRRGAAAAPPRPE
jgi:membrane-associated phospholipid phosphatase